MMTTLDGYPMAHAGRAGDALVLSGFASFVGAFLATIGLMLLAPLLAQVAFKFGLAEYFALYLLAFATLGGVASNNQVKAALASAIGLGIAMIGLGNFSGLPRLTRGNMHLFDGIDFLVAIVGLFAISEVFFFIESHGKNTTIGVKLEKVRIPWRDIFATRWTILRASGVGFLAGVLPGAGASLGSFLAYMSEKTIAGPKGKFGAGVAAPEAGNNAAAGVTMISFVGIYSLSASYFGLLLTVAFGVLGYVLRKLDIPTVPVILGILLGSHMEDALRRAMVLSSGDWKYLFSSWTAIGF